MLLAALGGLFKLNMSDLALTENKDIIYSGFILDRVGLKAIGEPSYEDWQNVGEFIKKAEGAVHFWIGDWLNYGEAKWGEMYSQAMDATGYEYGTLRDDKWLSSSIKLSDRSDNLGVAHARLIAPLPEEDKKYWAEELKKESIPVRELKEKIRERKFAGLPKPEVPKGKYNVIYADPPWDIGSFVLDKWESPLDDKYPTMTEEEIATMPIQDIQADDCVCFMWTTLTTLPEALRILERWGFKYHITLTWDKGGGWSSSGFHRRTELLLVGYKGILSNVVKQEGEFIPTFFYEPKREHSKKPDIMYQYIEDRTMGEKVELFARTCRPGWTVWGNQL